MTGIGEELQTSDRIAVLLHEVTFAYHRFTALAARNHATGVTELRALGYLRDEGAVSAGKLGESLGLGSASMTALIDRLERAGFAQRQPHPRDRRSVLVKLSEAGRTQVGNLFELIAPEVQNALSDLNPHEQEAVVRFLDKIKTSFEQHAESG